MKEKEELNLEKQEVKNLCENKEAGSLYLVFIISVLVFGLSFMCWGKKSDKFSYSERRVLADFPEISAENIVDGTFMEEFENYTLDQFPFRDKWRSLKAIISLGVFQNRDNNGIYYAKGHLSKLEYPLQMEMLDYAAEKIWGI